MADTEASAQASGRHLIVMDIDSTLINQEVIDLLGEEAGVGERVAEVTERAMRGEPQREPEQGGWVPEFVTSRMRLKQALALRSGASPDEQRRIAAILNRAADDIESGDQNA